LPTPATARRTRRHTAWLILVLAALVLVGAIAGGTALYRRGRLRAELADIDRLMDEGRTATARARLATLHGEWPSNAEVAYRLGLAELEEGRREEALAAWKLVRPGSPFFVRAAIARADLLINTGRYRPAEEALEAARDQALASEAYDVARRLVRLYGFEGRHTDIRRGLRHAIRFAPDPSSVLKELWALDESPFPVEAWRKALEHADPEDDRVWLGRAAVATLTGRYDEAAGWLARCLRQRPNDLAVNLAALALARARDDVAGVRSAAARIPLAALDESRRAELRAWIASRQGDPAREERELRAWLDRDPGSTRALERLATLAVEAGRPDEAQGFRRRKLEMDDAKARYRLILLDEGPGLSARATELAELARTLGRRFDADAWDAIARNATIPRETPEPPLTGMLAERLPVMDESPSRPTRAEVTPTRPDFEDVAEASGLRFTFDSGATELRELPETMSGGVGLLDYDGDGWLDVYCVQGGPIHPAPGRSNGGDQLFRNRGDGTFEDVTEAAGLAGLPRGYGLGVAVGDYDNDGDPDLFVSRLDTYALLSNRGDGTFQDVTEEAGLAGRRDNPTSAVFADLDNDGDLDLYVCHYMIWDENDPRLCRNEKGGYFYCDPSKVDPAPDRVFRNDGGRFVDVTEEAGIADPGGRGLGVVAADLDDDGLIDLFVANDGTANFLFHNLGGFRFEEVAHLSGVASGADGGYRAGMGVACGDLDGDGRPDLFVTNFYGESATYYRNLGGLQFVDRTAASGLGTATRYLLGFGIGLLDYDRDGRLDVLITNGHVNDNRPYYPYGMPTALLANHGGGGLADVSRGAGAPWDVPRVGRGLALGDLDRDGRVDAVLLPQNEPVALLRNRTKGGHWLSLLLEGTGSNRDAVGARVTIQAGGRKQTAWRLGGGSYQSANSPWLDLGLGPAEKVESVEVRWPSGRVDRYANLVADRAYRLVEGRGVAERDRPR
jgi:tetratricopeptide (TPR) repeat protein